jgi:Putative adhesin
MDMTFAQSTPKRSFFRTWRRELIRGGVLFTLVVGTGLFIRSFKDNVPTPWGVLGSFGDFDWGDGDGDRGGSLFGGSREVGDPWEFRTQLKPSQLVWIRNTNGPVNVMLSDNDWLEVTAEKSWRRSNPGAVELVAIPSARGITICALWDGRERRCAEDGDYRLNGVRKNDVAVRFTVHLPRGIAVDASTVNGPLEIVGVASPVEATTVNGRVLVNTASGPVKATTVNGSIEAIIHALGGEGDIDLTTVNGSVSAGLPARINATIDAQTVNGRVETDFPVKISGKISTRHLRGTIGTGGQRLRLNTVNGSIKIHEAGPEHQHAPTPHPMPSVQRPRAPRPARAPAVAPVAPTPPPSH